VGHGRTARYSDQAPRGRRALPGWIYRHRNEVERLWGRLKEWRAVATRYEKLAASFIGVLCLAASMEWLKV
jgi:transposase